MSEELSKDGGFYVPRKFVDYLTWTAQLFDMPLCFIIRHVCNRLIQCMWKALGV